MKNLFLSYASILLFFGAAPAQKLSGYFDNGIGLTIDFSGLKGNKQGEDYSVSGKSLWTPSGSKQVRVDVGSKTLENAYEKKAYECFKEAVKNWGKDWKKVIRLLDRAIDFDEKYYDYHKYRADAAAYKEWDEGVVLANEKKEWSKAMSKFRIAMQRFTSNSILINNIIICSRNEIYELADKYYKKKNWIYAEAYYGVLMKNFGESGWVVSRFSECATHVNKIPEDKMAHVEVSEKQKEIKLRLPFVANGW